MRRAAAIAALLAVAAVCGLVAYDTLGRRPHGGRDRWTQALAAARRAESTKAELPALHERNRASLLFLGLARSGQAANRSRAAMLAGLLQIRNAAADPTQRQAMMVEAARSLRYAVGLDRGNDDAAYDLELLLARARASGHPIAQGKPKQIRKHKGGPSAGAPGTGY
ncbi:MAG TPA: hypothetical protein VH816_03415 [Gaiellaceae bacterium]